VNSVEQFLREGTALPAGFRGMPEPCRTLALQTALRIRWQRYQGRVRHNLIAFGEMEGPRESRTLLAGLARRMAVVASLSSVDPGATRASRWEGSDELLAEANGALAAGRGLVVATPHLGYWQLPARVLARATRTWLMDSCAARLRPVSEGASAPPSPRPDDCSNIPEVLRRAYPVEVDGWTLALEALARNEIVVCAPDLPRPGSRSEAVWLLGRRVTMPAAPAFLAQVAQAPLLPVLCPLERRRPRLACGGLLPAVPGDGWPSATAQSLQQLVDVFSEAIQGYPDQWLGWIHPWTEPVRLRGSRPTPAARPQLAMAGV
jgi:lauroyl/myristoyl acyltransferase